MREHHRVQQADAAGEPDGELEGTGLQEADREEDDPQRGGRGAPPLGEPVREERLRDEAAAERVEGEESAQMGNDTA